MTLFVDTSVWSLALRRDQAVDDPRVEVLRRALLQGEPVATTGLVLQELLQGFAGARDRAEIVERFASLILLGPDVDDHVAAAEHRTRCRRAGVQIGTIDALLAQLCVRYELEMLTADLDFEHMARHLPLRVWRESG